MCHLRVVLLCKGRGADASSYKPNRDDSQWWNRRDALVRCCTAFLYGPAAPIPNIPSHTDDNRASASIISSNASSSSNTSSNITTATIQSRELVLIHDEDWSRTHMTLEFPVATKNNGLRKPSPPTEQYIISLWKSAALAAAAVSENIQGVVDPRRRPQVLSSSQSSGQLTCRVVRGPVGVIDMNAFALPSRNSLTGLDSKRKLLEHLHKHCPIEFLKTHGLNSKPDVILRKTNKKKLVQIWHEWCTSSKKHNTKQLPNNKTCVNTLQIILGEMMQPITPNIQKVVAGVLHESCEFELPCFGSERVHQEEEQTNKSTDENLQVCLFLGAVRDMLPSENLILRKVCSEHKIPLVGVRLGPVPEFTSKILTVVAHHHSRGILGIAMNELCRRRRSTKSLSVKDKRTDNAAESDTEHGPPRKRQRSNTISKDQNAHNKEITSQDVVSRQIMHTVCTLPMKSHEISIDLQKRNRALWCLVRVTVCALWRSRLASSTLDNNKNNKQAKVAHLESLLTIVFEDGLTMTLEQEELVTSLAEKHQAAPSENQILAALCRKRDKLLQSTKLSSNVEWDTIADHLVHSSLSNQVASYAIDIRDIDSESNKDDLCGLLHSSLEENSAVNYSGSALIFLSIRSLVRDFSLSEKCNARVALLDACRRCKIPVFRQSIVEPRVQDWEAATITMLQHFSYQKRLFPSIRELAHQSKIVLLQKPSLSDTLIGKVRGKKDKTKN